MGSPRWVWGSEPRVLSLLSAGGLCPGTLETHALAETRSDRAPPPLWQLWEAAGSLRKPLVDGKTTHWLSGGRFLACSEEAPGGTQQATASPPPRRFCPGGGDVGATSRAARAALGVHLNPGHPTGVIRYLTLDLGARPSYPAASPALLGAAGVRAVGTGVRQEESGGPRHSYTWSLLSWF